MCNDSPTDNDHQTDRPVLPSIFQIFDPRPGQLDGPSSLTLAPLHIRDDPDPSLRHPASGRPFPQPQHPSRLHPRPHDPRAGAPQINRNVTPSSSSSFLPSGLPGVDNSTNVLRTQPSSGRSYPSSHSASFRSQDPRSYPVAVPGPHSGGPHRSHASNNPPFSQPVEYVSQGPRYPEGGPPFESYRQSGPPTFRPSNVTHPRRPVIVPSNVERVDAGSPFNQSLPPSSRVASGGDRPSTEETAEGIFSAEYRHECSHCGKRFNRPSGLRIHLTSHTGDKPFVCPEENCGRSFGVLSNMRRHIRLMHQNSQEEQHSDELEESSDQ